jgi:hypothetical protein
VIRTSDTIVLPRRSTRADGVNPDASGLERAIFSYPGDVIPGVTSGPWVAQYNVRMAKAIVVLNGGSGGWVKFHINDVMLDETLMLTGLNQQMTFTVDHVLRAEVDTLEVSFEIGCEGFATDMSVFVSFSKADPI